MSSALFREYEQFVQSRTKLMGDNKLDFLHAAVGISTEAGGEILDVAKKLWVYDQNFDTVNKEGKTHEDNIHEELGDVLFYVQMACNVIGCTLESLMEANMEKLSKRYPTGYSDAAAAARADKSEGN
jgi:NTP pyrophosphatase (non-canonical NTP hydrolase)